MNARMLSLPILACVAALASCGSDSSFSDKAANDQVVTVDKDDPAMLAAMAKGARTLDEFLATVAKPPQGASHFAVKVRIRDGDRVEYFWVTPFTRDGDRWFGTLGNAPELVRNVVEGQTVSFDRADVVDWMYTTDQPKRMYGNFTACALLMREPAAEAEEFKKEYGLICD